MLPFSSCSERGPLRGIDDYRRFAGRRAKLVMREAVDGQPFVALAEASLSVAQPADDAGEVDGEGETAFDDLLHLAEGLRHPVDIGAGDAVM